MKCSTTVLHVIVDKVPKTSVEWKSLCSPVVVSGANR